jgi:hypothetical protein
MTQAELPKIFHLQFTPEHWSQLVRLRALLGKPLPTTRESYQALDACIGHLRKHQVFARIADRIIPSLPKDREELDRYGASRNLHSEEFGALTEATCGLYRGLLYIRMIEPPPDLNFNSGHCASWNWFEQDSEKFCPLAKQCGAYSRKWPGGHEAALAAV